MAEAEVKTEVAEVVKGFSFKAFEFKGNDMVQVLIDGKAKSGMYGKAKLSYTVKDWAILIDVFADPELVAKLKATIPLTDTEKLAIALAKIEELTANK